jgi:hypothetical protein
MVKYWIAVAWLFWELLNSSAIASRILIRSAKRGFEESISRLVWLVVLSLILLLLKTQIRDKSTASLHGTAK